MSLYDDWKTKKGIDRFWTWLWDRPHFVFGAILAGVFYWLLTLAGSMSQKDDRRYYNDCLQIVLARASVDVAETMCGHMRK